ncbi:serine protease [Actinomyces sp.]|uniref:trypsin-like serine peptidase n=1 Tax=Actinomyces sp. TaxID=29317 RepID=UPI0026DB08D2|nr:serine protease [Actinomyces sp.]MDO4900491.1 serine protease [Actinomyces sp.]
MTIAPAVAAPTASGDDVPAAASAAAAPGPAAVADEGGQAASTAVVAPDTFGQEPVLASEADLEAAAPDQDVLDYWTPERMAQAQPADVVAGSEQVVAASDNVADGEEGTSAPAVPAADVLAQAEAAGVFDDDVQTVAAGSDEEILAAQRVTNFSITNGKLFFNGYGQGNSYCSASAVNTPSKRVIITAGHCVYSHSDGGWMRNLVFVPGYDATRADPDPVGIWTARTLRTFNSWITYRDMTYDVGFVTLNNGGDHGRRIVDAVGGHGLIWNSPMAVDVSIFGYPSNKLNPYGRYTMWACWGGTHADGPRVSIVGCDFGRGASGGPWLQYYNNDSGVGYVNSVTSTWRPATYQNWGPYFTSQMKIMLDATISD